MKVKNITAIISFVCIFIFISTALPKRAAPKEVEDVIYLGIKYTAPLNKMAYVIAYDTEGNKKIWGKQIYNVIVDPSMEHDVQEIYITSLNMENDKLIITNEHKEKYRLDVETLNIDAGVNMKARKEKTIEDPKSTVKINPANEIKMSITQIKASNKDKNNKDFIISATIKNISDKSIKISDWNPYAPSFYTLELTDKKTGRIIEWKGEPDSSTKRNIDEHELKPGMEYKINLRLHQGAFNRPLVPGQEIVTRCFYQYIKKESPDQIIISDEITIVVGKGYAGDKLNDGVQKLIQQLGAGDWDERNSATKTLIDIGEPALPILKKAAIDDVNTAIEKNLSYIIDGITRSLPFDKKNTDNK
jgi:hypothetical protein